VYQKRRTEGAVLLTQEQIDASRKKVQKRKGGPVETTKGLFHHEKEPYKSPGGQNFGGLMETPLETGQRIETCGPKEVSTNKRRPSRLGEAY